jgi:hypothetical protein
VYKAQSHGSVSVKCLAIRLIGKAHRKSRAFKLGLLDLGIYPLNQKSFWLSSELILNELTLYC